MGTRYTRGRSAEYYVMKKLRELGATFMVRSAGSHTLADIIAFFPDKGEIWLVQVKQSKKGVSVFKLNLEYEELVSLRGDYRVRTGFFYHGKDGWDNTFARD